MKSHAQLEREVEVLEILPRQRGNRNRDAREVDALVRGDRPADDDAASGPIRLHLLDAEAHHPVVDQDFVAGTPHLADCRGRDRQLAVPPAVLGGDDGDVLARPEHDRSIEVSDAELGPLQIADDGDRSAGLPFRCTDELRAPRMVVVRPMREVETRRIHPGLDECAYQLRARRCGTDRGDDLRAARAHASHTLNVAPRGDADALFAVVSPRA